MKRSSRHNRLASHFNGDWCIGRLRRIRNRPLEIVTRAPPHENRTPGGTELVSCPRLRFGTELACLLAWWRDQLEIYLFATSARRTHGHKCPRPRLQSSRSSPTHSHARRCHTRSRAVPLARWPQRPLSPAATSLSAPRRSRQLSAMTGPPLQPTKNSRRWLLPARPARRGGGACLASAR